jgi:hypothetical protein
MNRIFFRWLLISLLFTLPLISHAGLYKWVDEEGNVHFGDQPPEPQIAQSIDIKPAPKADPLYSERLRKQQNFLEQRQEDREERQKTEAKQKQQRNEEQQLCQKAKNELTRFEPRGRIYVPRPDGNHYYMDDNEKQAYLTELRRKVKMYCK